MKTNKHKMEKSKTFKVSKGAAQFFDKMLKNKTERKEQTRRRFEKGELSVE